MQNAETAAPSARPKKSKPRQRRGRAPIPPMTNPRPDDMIPMGEVCRMTGLPELTIDNWRRQDRFPKPVKYGTSRNSPIRWRRSVITAWIEEFEKASAA